MSYQITKYFTLLFVLFMFACRQSTPLEDSPADVEVDNSNGSNKIYIIDRTGKKWDVTHAVAKYGFKAEEFQFGAGPTAIPPILEPKFLSPLDAGYPSAGDVFKIIGFVSGLDVRAYPIYILKTFEVANDVYGDRYVAATY